MIVSRKGVGQMEAANETFTRTEALKEGPEHSI